MLGVVSWPATIISSEFFATINILSNFRPPEVTPGEYIKAINKTKNPHLSFFTRLF